MARKRAAAPVEAHEEGPPWERDFPAWDLEELTEEEEQLAWEWYYEQEATANYMDLNHGKEN